MKQLEHLLRVLMRSIARGDIRRGDLACVHTHKAKVAENAQVRLSRCLPGDLVPVAEQFVEPGNRRWACAQLIEEIVEGLLVGTNAAWQRPDPCGAAIVSGIRAL